jgi:uncharacterized protein YcsI (UPF0317 family)
MAIVTNNTRDEGTDLSQLREQIRSNEFTGNTSGLMPGLVQGNVVILPANMAEEFMAFCRLNPIPCPIIGFSKAGDPSLPSLGGDIDIRVDVPEYCIFREGELCETVTDISRYWQDDFVSIVIGCSYSFEDALMSAGYHIRNIDLELNVSMYDTTIPTQSTEHFSGNTVVSMRPFNPKDIAAVTDITNQFSKAHGAPIHIGDPAAIGISNIQQPDYGDAVLIATDEVPVFWGCGVTSQRILRDAKLPLVITHAPGKMLITDVCYEQL